MDWNIAKSRHICTQCEAELPEEQQYTSALNFSDDAVVRHDFCDRCWEANELDYFSFWRTEVPKTVPNQKRMVDAQLLMEIFQKLDGVADRPKQNFRFLLGLILLRKKLFALVTTRFDNGNEYLILKLPKDDRQYDVLNPRMTDDETEAVREQLAQVFEADFSSLE